MDALGRYTLSEMRRIVRRLVWGATVDVDPTTGDEAAGTEIYDTLISNQDLNDEINRSLTFHFLEANQLSQDSAISTVYMNISANQLSFALPPDMLTLKELAWKTPSIANGITAAPWNYQPLVHLDEPSPISYGGSWPTVHRDGNLMVFDQTIPENNANGVRIRYVRWTQILTSDTAVIQGQLARALQEATIYRAAKIIQETRRRQVSEGVSDGYQQWHDALIMAAGQVERPSEVQMHSGNMVKSGFSGRRRRRGGW